MSALFAAIGVALTVIVWCVVVAVVAVALFLLSALVFAVVQGIRSARARR